MPGVTCAVRHAIYGHTAAIKAANQKIPHARELHDRDSRPRLRAGTDQGVLNMRDVYSGRRRSPGAIGFKRNRYRLPGVPTRIGKRNGPGATSRGLDPILITRTYLKIRG